MKYTTGQMPSQNSSKITMIEMVELTHKRNYLREFYIQLRKEKLTYHQENPRMIQTQQ